MKTVFFDIDSQLDFLYPAGALYAPGAEKIVPAIARLNHFAAASGIPVVSTTDAHTEDDPEFRLYPPHCVAGTWGQHKPESTLLHRRVTVPNRECPLAIEGAAQIILEKQTVDAFETRNLPSLLDLLGAERCLVYGVVTEICVFHAARGLLRAGRSVALVTDAIAELDAANARKAIDEVLAAGATLTTVSEVCGQ